MSDWVTNRQQIGRLLAQPKPSDAGLLEEARGFYRDQIAGGDVRNGVRHANSRIGTDFATAVLYAHFESRLKAWSSDTVVTDVGLKRESIYHPNLVIAPGAFHREHPEAGGDGRAVLSVAEGQGWDCQCLPTESLGTLDVNARRIVEWFEEQREDCVIVSLSKGTSDFMAALALRPELANQIHGWISVSGIISGTPMANWLLERKRLRPAFWLMRWKHSADIQAVRDLRSGNAERLPALARRLCEEFAAKIPIFHLVGFPLRRHLSCFRAKLWHRRFRRYGPNDSVVILEDLLDAPGVVVPVWGADHYLRSSWDSAAALTEICKACAPAKSV